MNRILIVNVNWLGDALFSTPAIRAIRKANPDARIECLAPDRCREILEGNPHLDEVIAWSDDTRFTSIFSTLRLAAALKKRRYDRAYFFHGSNTKAFAAALAGIPERIGLAPAGKGRFLTKAVVPPPGRPHKIDYFLHLTGSLGIPPDGRTMDFVPKPSARADELLKSCGISEGEPFVAMHPGGNWDLKRWPVAHFAEWIRLFHAKKGWKTVICGTPSESAVADEIAGLAGADKACSISGKTSITDLAAVLGRARFLISNDSGPIHLAASQRVKVLGLFGPTSPAETGPVSAAPVSIARLDVGCGVPCYFRSCSHRVCMEELKPERVAAMAEELLR